MKYQLWLGTRLIETLEGELPAVLARSGRRIRDITAESRDVRLGTVRTVRLCRFDAATSDFRTVARWSWSKKSGEFVERELSESDKEGA